MNKEFLLKSIQTDRAINFIEPNLKQYLDVTRITKSVGRVGKVYETKLIGYAILVHKK